MRDRDVRSALHRQLLTEHSSELARTRFVDELGLYGEVRVDVAVINGALSGFELKSARDNLRRLPKQVDIYSKVLDFSTLVVAENHLEAAIRLLRPSWGVVVVHQHSDEFLLDRVREATPNPDIDPKVLAMLLWRDEALGELTAINHDRGFRSKSRRAICEHLAETVGLRELQRLVRERLKARENWRSE
jgi:hypothetical protein